MATALHVKNVGLEDFEGAVIEESRRRPVAVDFWAPWCGPCRILGPILEKLAAEFAGDFLLAKVNTETNPELAGYFQIRSIPNVKMFVNGRVVDEITGAVPEREVRDFLRLHCPSAADRKHAEGIQLLEKGQLDEARAAFEAALEQDLSHAAALLELGKLSATAGDTNSAISFWDRIPVSSPLREHAETLKKSVQFQIVCAQAGGPEVCAQRATAEADNLEARYAQGCCQAAAGNYRAALEEFLIVVSRDKHFREQAARKAMLTLFALVGERSDLADEYRKRLAMVLF